jgi:hypothetical protein
MLVRRDGRGIALANLGSCDNMIGDDFRHGRPEISQRFAGIVESLAHRRGRGVVEPNVLGSSVFIVTSRETRAGALYCYCLSATEAQSRFGNA